MDQLSLMVQTRHFDPFDILANLIGSAGALILCTWYHKRMLERKRQTRKYQPVPTGEDAGIDADVGAGEEMEDLEAGRVEESENQEQDIGDAR